MPDDRKPRRAAASTETVSASSLLKGLRAGRTFVPAGELPGALFEREIAGAPGSLVGDKYVVERTLGAGATGIVVAAVHAQLGHRVAIKLVRGDAALDETSVGRFLRESRAVAALANEHVARVLDVGALENGGPYVVTEYLEGLDLGQMLLRYGPLSVSLAIEVVLQACEALAEAHAREIVHGSLKPTNLLATTRADGSRLVKVLDFGIAKLRESENPHDDEGPTTRTFVGSPAYLSPEQLQTSAGPGPRSDVWALGVILYELLAGISPFASTTRGETLAKIVADDPRPLGEIRRDLPDGLAATIAHCLARSPQARVQGVTELAAKLRAFAQRETLAVPDRRAERLEASTDSSWLRANAVDGLASGRGRWVALGSAIVVGTAALVAFCSMRTPPAGTVRAPGAADSLRASTELARASETSPAPPSATAPAPSADRDAGDPTGSDASLERAPSR